MTLSLSQLTEKNTLRKPSSPDSTTRLSIFHFFDYGAGSGIDVQGNLEYDTEYGIDVQGNLEYETEYGIDVQGNLAYGRRDRIDVQGDLEHKTGFGKDVHKSRSTRAGSGRGFREAGGWGVGTMVTTKIISIL